MKNTANNIEIKLADKNNFTIESLDDFSRFQLVNNTYHLIGRELRLEHNPLTEDWSAERRREKAAEILSGEYITYCAIMGNKVVGEIMLIPRLNEGRLIADSFHVSTEYRRMGIGRRLFEAAKEEARRRGARSIYLSACSAEETIDFYLTVGCRVSDNPIPEYAADEPFDIQMECEV